MSDEWICLLLFKFLSKYIIGIIFVWYIPQVSFYLVYNGCGFNSPIWGTRLLVYGEEHDRAFLQLVGFAKTLASKKGKTTIHKVIFSNIWISFEVKEHCNVLTIVWIVWVLLQTWKRYQIQLFLDQMSSTIVCE